MCCPGTVMHAPFQSELPGHCAECVALGPESWGSLSLPLHSHSAAAATSASLRTLGAQDFRVRTDALGFLPTMHLALSPTT